VLVPRLAVFRVLDLFPKSFPHMSHAEHAPYNAAVPSRVACADLHEWIAYSFGYWLQQSTNPEIKALAPEFSVADEESGSA